MSFRLAIDRFAGDDKRLAVLLTDDGQEIIFPRALLPDSSKPGDVLSLQIARDEDATRKLHEEATELEAELDRRDPGGDIKL